MTTITEDYCSKEIYRLLLEKGFNGEIHTTFDKEGYTKPSITLQIAMKWLREVHPLVIQIELIDFLEHGEVWFYSVLERKTIKQLTGKGEDFTEHSYEQACEAAIKYCLEYLI